MRRVANGREHPSKARHVAASQQMAFHAHCLIPTEITPSLDALVLLFVYSGLFALDLGFVESQAVGTQQEKSTAEAEQPLAAAWLHRAGSPAVK